MKPYLPVEIPQGATLYSVFPLELECAMLRAGVRCNNLAYETAIFPSEIGYTIIPFCQHCIDESDEDWILSLEKVVTGDSFKF